ncbi:COX15/CtaA family protein [Curtobacterium ammoniigenes]|uniref:COX15/CtaA family protein n=1 Tax=Curtobacterium ammoniigenes TaxID=395387 RepID=UPI0009FA53DF|nr:COX15/CtaA family protein [Curtobacterium ammoniigenes]
MTRVGTTASRPSLTSLFWPLPAAVDLRVVVLAWASLVIQIVLIGTGGLVRLTASGLGCPTWPQCTDGSFVTTPAMGIHGVIEFGNRLLTFVLVFVVVLMFLAVVRMRRTRPELWWLAFAQGASIPVQAVVGGLSVLTNLNPYVVGLHFVISAALVSIASRLVYRSVRGPRVERLLVPRWYVLVGHWLLAAVAVTVLLGILTTGSGPHAGAATTVQGGVLQRTGFNPAVIEDLHAIPAFATFLLTLVLLVGAVRAGLPIAWPLALLVVEFVQIGVGITQALTALPVGLVGLHMVLAGVLIAVTAGTVLSMRASAGREAVVGTQRPARS